MSALLRRAWEWATGRSWVWLGLVFGVDAVIAVAGIAIGKTLNMTALLSAGPLLACARCNGRVTALVTGYAIALCAFVAWLTASLTTPIQRDRFAVIGMSGILAVVVAIIRERREKRLIQVADRVQRAILRPLPAEIGGIAFASHYQSATPGTMVGGDVYDLTMTQFGPRLIIGDVKGKGLDAVSRCAAVIGAFRELAYSEADLVKLAERMDDRLAGDMGAEDFVTVIIAEFGEGEVRLANCGHHSPLKVGPSTADGEMEMLAPERCALPLGLRADPVLQSVVLKRGDRLLFYTDGLVEARNRAGQFISLDGPVADALAVPGLDACIVRVAALLLEHVGNSLGDDVLLVAAEPRG
jgi:phosphoserine phosphatase RsbU/P